MAFHEAWKRAAADGRFPSTDELEPGLHVDLLDEQEVPFFGDQ
ncbi:hypothetical protein ACFWM5_38885 [Streptomyces bobili]